MTDTVTPEATQVPTQTLPLLANGEIRVDTPEVEFTLCSPIAGIKLSYLPKIISDPYHPPPPKSDARHEGVDFSYYSLDGRRAFIAGVGIQSVMPGRVAAAIADSYPYGNFVIIETPHALLPVAMQHRLKVPEGVSVYLLYAHMQSAPLVSLGEQVSACQLVGKVGHSGNAGVDHLHFEARLGPSGASFPGMGSFKPNFSAEERANYTLWRTSGTFNHFNPMLIFVFQ